MSTPILPPLMLVRIVKADHTIDFKISEVKFMIVGTSACKQSTSYDIICTQSCDCHMLQLHEGIEKIELFFLSD